MHFIKSHLITPSVKTLAKLSQQKKYRRATLLGTICVGLLSSPIFFSAISPSQIALAAGLVIDRVEVRGNSRVDAGTVILQIRSKVGSSFSQEQVSADIKEIYRTGFFEKVTAKLEHRGSDEVLVFEVVEKPSVAKVLFSGNSEIDSDKLKEKLNLSGRFFLDKRKIEAGLEDIRKYYQSEGYWGTSVSYETSPIKDNQVEVTIKVEEGEKKRIRQLAFEGNHKVKTSELESVVDTSTYFWLTSWVTGGGVVKQEQLENDSKELSKYYLNHGFVEIKVAEPKVEEIEDGLRVTFKVEEGEIYSLNKIGVKGDLLENSENKTLEGIESKSGDTFNLEQLRKDTITVASKFTDIGYAFANVEPETQVSKGDRSVNVKFNVSKGSLVTVNKINISGNRKTQDNVIRRSLQLEERELFSSSKIQRSQELLQRLGYFDEVTIAPEPTDKQGEVDLGVAVKEGNTGSFSLGAGVSSGDGFIFTSKISENNLFGSGNSLSLDLNTGSTRQNYVLSFNNPRVDDSRLSFGADILSTKREYDDFDKEQQGGSMNFGYPLWFLGADYLDDVRASLSYDLLNVDISNIDPLAPQLIKDSEGSSISSSVTPQIVRNTIDNPLDPSKGSRQQVSVEVAGLGGDEEFYLLQASNTFYYPLWKSPVGNFVFSNRLRVGYGDTWNDESFPLFKRFFPGGINSVRGYEARVLGPKDENGREYGGSKQLIANFEIIYPLFQSVGISGVFFYDAGQAFDDDVSIDIGELRQAVGWGIRWKSPLAPIRLEFGYPIDKEEGEKSFVTNFSLGAPS